MRALKERFFEKINKTGPNGCWIWNASKYPNGYGQFTDNRDGKWKPYGAHRISYEIHNGPIPAGLVVCHTCDVKECVNPDHLFVGTQAENLKDMVNKGRSRGPMGELSGRAKLCNETIAEIRRLIKDKTLTQKEIGEKFGVSDSAISRVKTGKRWGHI